VHGIAARYGESTEAMQQSIRYARKIGDERLLARNALGLSSSTLLGPTKVPDAIKLCEDAIAGGLADRQTESKILCMLAQLYAMSGDFGAARQRYVHARELLRDLGQGLVRAGTAIDLLTVELLAEDRLSQAELDVRSDLEFLRQAGETYRRSTLAALLSRAVREQGRDDEAMELSREAEATSAEDDMDSQALWRSVRALLLARSGEHAEAIAMARHAVRLMEGSDSPQLRADTRVELARVLAHCGDRSSAELVMREAFDIYEAKGAAFAAARAIGWIEE
jgi:tetratricopeptide (TPR) repeat protein